MYFNFLIQNACTSCLKTNELKGDSNISLTYNNPGYIIQITNIMYIRRSSIRLTKTLVYDEHTTLLDFDKFSVEKKFSAFLLFN